MAQSRELLFDFFFIPTYCNVLTYTSIYIVPLGTPKACESRVHLTDLQGIISSPNFSGPYPANSTCTWIITPPQSANLSFRFTSFDVQSNSKQCGGKKCRCDFVQVKELDPPQNAVAFNKKFCNANRPNMMYNLTSRVGIRFVSDSAEEGIGFSLIYEAVRSPNTAPAATFDFAGVHPKAALRSGSRGRAALPVNQTVVTATLTSASSDVTDVPTQSAASPNLTSSGVDVPLSAFTSKPPVNFTTAADRVVQLTSENIVLSSAEQPATTNFPRTFPVTGAEPRSTIWTSPVHVVMAAEEKKVEEKVPDIIILGPSVPVVMIFILVVAGIAWWNYKFNSEELNRYVHVN